MLQRSLRGARLSAKDDAEEAGIAAVEDGDGEDAADVAGLAVADGGLVDGDEWAGAFARGEGGEGGVGLGGQVGGRLGGGVEGKERLWRGAGAELVGEGGREKVGGDGDCGVDCREEK